MLSPKNFAAYADRAGMWLSTLCLIHCLLTPLILLGLPALSLLVLSESLHQALAIVLPAVALAAFVPGYRRHHQINVIYLGAVGLMLIIGAALFAPSLPALAEAVITVGGSVLLVRAHWLNHRLSECKSPHHAHHFDHTHGDHTH